MGKIDRNGRYIAFRKDICKQQGDIIASKLRPRNELRKGPRVMAIYEYVHYKRADGKNATHGEKLRYACDCLREGGYGESTILNAIRWIKDYKDGITNELGQPIKGKGGDDGR